MENKAFLLQTEIMNGAHVFRTHESIILAKTFKEALDFFLENKDFSPITNLHEGANGLMFDIPQHEKALLKTVWGVLKYEPIQVYFTSKKVS